MDGGTGPGPRARVGAAVDVGSNSVHLLVALVGRSSLRPLLDESVLLGLGAIVDREGRLPAEARDATVGALAAYVERARSLSAQRITLVATEPIRRASNRSVLQSDVRSALGHPLHLLSHEAEAELTLLGVTHGRPLSGSLVVLDIGGGSSEAILAAPSRVPLVGAFASGSNRLTRALVEHDPPTWFEVDALRSEARRLVAALPEGRPDRAVVVGGSGTNLLRITPRDDASPQLDRPRLQRALDLLTTRTATALVEEFAINLPRARQLAAGVALVEAFLGHYALDGVEVSDASLREGAILAAAVAGDDWPERLSQLVAGAHPRSEAHPT